MSAASTATINYTLTQYAAGLMNDLADVRQVVNALCPIVSVQGASGQFKSFDDINSFKSYNTARPLGGQGQRIRFSATDGSFDCKPQSLEAAVDDHERERAGQNNAVAQQLLDQGKIRALLNSAALSHVDKVITFINANTSAVSGVGNWENEDIDPVDQIDSVLDDLSKNVGRTTGITLTLGVSTWRAFRMHPKVKARISGVQVGGISYEQAKGLFIFPLAGFVVGAISKLTSGEGQTTKTKGRVIGDVLFASYGMSSPTVYDPSPFKCFTTGTSGAMDQVRTYRDEPHTDVHLIDWSEDIKATGTAAIRRMDITLPS